MIWSDNIDEQIQINRVEYDGFLCGSETYTQTVELWDINESSAYTDFMFIRKLKGRKRKRAKIIAKEKSKAYHNNRRILKLTNGTGLSVEQWKTILEKYNFRCAYCGILGKDTKQKYLTQDHVISLNKGGLHSPENIVPACVSCNSSKGDRDGWIPNIFSGEDSI